MRFMAGLGSVIFICMTISFKEIAVVLVQPAGDLNLGTTARAMKNTGFADLVLVDPTAERSQAAYRMAPGAGDILDDARVFSRLDQAVADKQVVFGVTARPRHKRNRLTPGQAAGVLHGCLAEGQKIALIFGPEDCGLSTTQIDLCSHLIGIPAHPEHTSFNLAQAVLLICHAIFQHGSASLEESTRPMPASQADRGRLPTRTLDLLTGVAYLTENRDTVLREMVRRLVYRTDLETRDIRNLLAIIRHIEHRLNSDRNEP